MHAKDPDTLKVLANPIYKKLVYVTVKKLRLVLKWYNHVSYIATYIAST